MIFPLAAAKKFSWIFLNSQMNLNHLYLTAAANLDCLCPLVPRQSRENCQGEQKQKTREPNCSDEKVLLLKEQRDPSRAKETSLIYSTACNCLQKCKLDLQLCAARGNM